MAKAHVPASMGNPAMEVAGCIEQPGLSVLIRQASQGLDLGIILYPPCKALMFSAPRKWHSRGELADVDGTLDAASMKVELPKDECSESVDGRGSTGENAGLEERMLRSELRLAESERERALRETLSVTLSDSETRLR